MKLQRRSESNFSVVKSLMIAYYMGGVSQAKKAAKKLKKKVNEPASYNLLSRIGKSNDDGRIKESIETMHSDFVKAGLL